MFWHKLTAYIRAFPYKFKKTKVKAVHESDLLKLLSSLGVLEQLKDGDYRCLNCSTVIDLDNLGAILVKDGKIKIICSNPNCITGI
ncbi:hypothetical protein KJA15_03080 [Patescibacteria group bacterium]|nr:hypothetical protein [Patescibacteria group bacterium]